MNLSGANESAAQHSASNFLSYVRSLRHIAGKIYSELPWHRRYKKTAHFLLNSLRYREEFEALQNVFDSPELSEVMHLCPAILDKPFSPYVQIDWGSIQRYEQLRNHFLMLKELFGKSVAEIYKPQGYRLFEFTCHAKECYSVELFSGYQNEGSIGIRLCDDQNREVYTLSLHMSGIKGKTCYIGALQGPNYRIPDRQKTIVSLTRGLHGLRPKALMLETLYMVAYSLKLEQIYGVSNIGNIYNASIYSAKITDALRFDRDQMWREYHAVRISASLFQFPQEPIRKDIALLKPNKRSMYRKRYAWLEKAAVQTNDAINRLLANGTTGENQYDVTKAA
ncbi:MAG: hypothetical protein ACI9UN_003826 [Granulosicoccus sp.]